MEEAKDKAKRLLDRYLTGNCTETERELVESIYQQSALSRQIKNDQSVDFDAIADKSWVNILKATAPAKEHSKPVASKLWPLIAIAASLLLTLGTAIYFYSAQEQSKYQPLANDIKPGKNRATLTLDDGKTIELSDQKSGVIFNDQANNSSFTYNDGTGIAVQLTKQVTAATPRGGQYQLTLADGTKVWLNSASTLKFPASFNSTDTRKVSLTGEAYFEVQHLSDKPFIVKTENQEVKVLGTHFNIYSYPKEQQKTTLLTGSVRVSSAIAEQILQPGQQAIQTSNGKLSVSHANAYDVIAWKNGYFTFDNEPLESVMLKISRWYDLQVQFDDLSLKTEIFGGSISRYENVSKVLYMLEKAGKVRFQLNGKTIIISK